MDNTVQLLFSELIKQPKVSFKEITHFGTQIGNTFLKLSDEEIKNTVDTLYTDLLRKGNTFFDAFEDNYDHAILSSLRTGINETVWKTLSKDDAWEFSDKLKKLTDYNRPLSSLITKQVAICLGENVDDDTRNLKLHHLSNEIIRYTSHNQPSLKKTNEQITEAWNNVYDEFALHNRLDLLPKFATMTIKELNDSYNSEEKIKAAIQGLSNLKNADSATLDFSDLLKNLHVQNNDSISVSVNQYYQNPNNKVFKSVVEDLTKQIISKPINEQALLWDKVREEFSMPVFKNNKLEKTRISENLAMHAINFIETDEQREQLLKGISGTIDIVKKENLFASITNMRHKFTGEYAIPMKKIV